MNLINRDRQTGKTTMLIYTAHVTGYPIIVWDITRAKIIEHQAYKLGCTVNVFTINQWEHARRGYRVHDVLIDEAKDFIEAALNNYLGANVAACTATFPMDKIPSPEEKENKEDLKNG